MKRKLNKYGLLKLIPYLDGLSEEVYGDCGGVNISIGYDGRLRIDVNNPNVLVVEAIKNGVELTYIGADKNNDACFEAYVIEQEIPAMAPNLPQDVGSGAAAPAPVGRAGAEKAAEMQRKQAQSQDEERRVQEIMKRVQDQVNQMLKNFGQQMADIAKTQQPI